MFQKRNTTFAPLITISVLRWNVPAAQVVVGTFFLFFSFHLVGTSKRVIFASEIDWKHRIFAFLLLVCCSEFFCCSKIIHYNAVYQSVMNGKCFAHYILHREVGNYFVTGLMAIALCLSMAVNICAKNQLRANSAIMSRWFRRYIYIFLHLSPYSLL